MKAADVWFHVTKTNKAPFTTAILSFRWFDEQKGELFAGLEVPMTESQLDRLLTHVILPCVRGKVRQRDFETKGKYVESNRGELRIHLYTIADTFHIDVTDILSRRSLFIEFTPESRFFSELCQGRGPRGFCSLSDLTQFLVSEA